MNSRTFLYKFSSTLVKNKDNIFNKKKKFNFRYNGHLIDCSNHMFRTFEFRKFEVRSSNLERLN